MQKRILIVGGVAGGANAATRLRRLDERAEIIVFERGAYVSFANCGLPYHIGDEIKERSKLLQHTPESLKERFSIDVRIEHEVISVDRARQEVEVLEKRTGRTYRERYDNLILSPGAAPLRPPVPGLSLPGVFSLRDVPDMDKIISWVRERTPQRAAIVGGGFIGLEMLEQLVHKGLQCVLFESNPQVLTPLDPEMASRIQTEIRNHGVSLELSNPVNAIEATPEGSLKLTTKRGTTFDVDLVIWSIGVRPETKLASDAGLTIGVTGGIKVNQHLQTSDPAIYAVGDCIEVTHGITNTPAFIPLAGPANRQGRIAADNICGINSRYRATIGTAIVRVFSLTAACTGANERLLTRADVPFKAIHLHPNSHAGYYPGATPITLKVIFNPETGVLLGAQAVGEEGVDKRIDVIATAIQGELTIEEIAQLELCYAPPFGSAKDPINMAGMIGENIRNGLVSTVTWSEIDALKDSHILLDVRDAGEIAKNGAIPDALHIPLNSLRSRLTEVPKAKPLIVYCHSGQRSYNACRILSQHGYICLNLSGAFATWRGVALS